MGNRATDLARLRDESTDLQARIERFKGSSFLTPRSSCSSIFSLFLCRVARSGGARGGGQGTDDQLGRADA